MFESIVLRNSRDAGNITLGAIAEALLFYQNSRVIFNHGTLVTLAKTGDLGHIVALVKEGRLQAVHCEETLGTITNSHGISQAHDFGAFTLVGHEADKGKNRAERIEIGLRTSGGLDRAKAKALAKSFADAVPLKSLTKDDYVKGGILNAARIDAKDHATLKGLLRAGLAAVPGGYDAGDSLEADYVQSDLGYFLFTNIDFAAVNERRASMNPTLEPLTPASLFNLILESRADMHLAAFYGGDFVTTSANSALVRWRQAYLFERADRNSEAHEQFSELVLADYPSIRDVIDSGEQSFFEFLKLLEKAEKFKTWLAKATPDQKLVSQYIEALKADTWADKAPAKLLRYLVSLGAGLFDPTSGVVSGAADAFLVDRILKGWRPNHFVDDRLKPFLS
ncbi:hypothetical protein [Variovorax sp. UMC13]|uniref:hypothetical protein n=1 Tax=Variovorax sp. UMC13 TaxID=1862326 RepID=UPI0016012EED|nr:hypothetical protein [Variovorax sp. UMC13]